MTKHFQDIFYDRPDGLTLYARDYGPHSQNPVLFCMHGLTRNSMDFHALALHLEDGYRVISVDQRGRGRSDSDPNPANYRTDVYCEDMFALLRQLNLTCVTAIGTSMGGLMTMMMAAMKPGIFNAAIINDIGPEIEPTGLERIKGYVGGGGPFESWASAAAALKAQGPDVFPNYTEADWMAFARRTCMKTAKDKVEFFYDAAISEPFKNDDTAAAPVDMWPVFKALGSIPVLSIRGAMSDILSAETVEKMQQAHPDFTSAEIPHIGHAPMLDEPESLAAIGAFLKAKL